MNTNKSMYKWKTLPWKKIEWQVFKLQKRIYQASSKEEEVSMTEIRLLRSRMR